MTVNDYNSDSYSRKRLYSIWKNMKSRCYCRSKGKGFAGTIKRYGNHTLKASHGTGPVARHAGSMAGASDPSRIPKGKKMPGHMGHERVTIQNLVVAKVDVENNLIAIKGAVPGPKGGVIIITNSIKKS